MATRRNNPIIERRNRIQRFVPANEYLVHDWSGSEESESDEDDTNEEGYDCQFVDTDTADNYKCPICHMVVRDAHQVNCCGKILCHNCLMRHKDASTFFDDFNCPCCREQLGTGPTGVQRYFQDTRSNREILSLKVYCTHRDAGCHWIGELRQESKHSENCPFKNISCTKCSEQMLKRDLQYHESNKCPMRVYKCTLCGEEGTYKSITGEHKLEKCPKVVLPCKNLGCTIKVQRCKMPLHRQSCPKEVVKCPYNEVGCTYSAEREVMEEHVMANTELHLSKAVKRVREMQPKAVCPTVIKFSDFSIYKALEKRWFSPGVYTCEGGYKFRLMVYPNGNGDGEGSHVSVFFNLMRGEYDDTLGWPLRGKFIVQALNQLEDAAHHEESITFNANANKHVCRKEEEDDQGVGKYKFLAQSSLSLNTQTNTQYLVDDTLYFKVDVTLHSKTKPWLTKLCI